MADQKLDQRMKQGRNLKGGSETEKDFRRAQNTKIWFLWNYAPGKNCKKSKVPMSASGGVTGISDNFRNTWTDYDTAIRAKEKLSAAGIGFKVPDNMYFHDIDCRPLDDSFVQLLL